MPLATFTHVATLYTAADCPGVHPNSTNPFPEINTLLSIPFSVLHNFLRLASFILLSQYQADLIAMSLLIMSLWCWDPSPQELAEYKATAKAAPPLPRPPSIHHPSRESMVYPCADLFRLLGATAIDFMNAFSPTISSSTTNTSLPNPPWEYENRLQITAEMEEEKQLFSIGEGLSSGVNTMASVLVDGSSDSEEEQEEIEITPSQLSSADILDWLNHVESGTIPEHSSVPLAFFKKGDMRAMAVNDILMIRGLIDPGLYIQYLDLSSNRFSVL